MHSPTDRSRGREHALSEIDLMVIGNIGLSDLAPVLKKVEAGLGREVNVTILLKGRVPEEDLGE